MQRSAQRIAGLALAATMAGACLVSQPAIAHAASYEELQERVESSTAAYEEAKANVAQIQGEITENEGKIAELEEKIPAQRQRAAESIRTLYKMQQSSNGLIDLVLSADDFNSFLSTVTYLDRIQGRNMEELEALAKLGSELQEAKDVLSARKAQADQEATRAWEAQEDALAAREEVRLQAIAQAEAERAEAQAALEQAAREAEEGKTFTNASGQEAAVSTPEQDTSPAETVTDEPEKEQEEKEQEAEPAQEEPAPEEPAPAPPIESERDAFVSKWAGRIDAYLAGSPLGGHGRTFAEAAWDYNVDPRWSPAISCIESSKGAICFLPHNAWGWGSSSWGDWDTAIRSHVAGLSAGYGYTISTAAAQQYCPPTWQAWYSSVLAEMSCI